MLPYKNGSVLFFISTLFLPCGRASPVFALDCVLWSGRAASLCCSSTDVGSGRLASREPAAATFSSRGSAIQGTRVPRAPLSPIPGRQARSSQQGTDACNFYGSFLRFLTGTATPDPRVWPRCVERKSWKNGKPEPDAPHSHTCPTVRATHIGGAQQPCLALTVGEVRHAC